MLLETWYLECSIQKGCPGVNFMTASSATASEVGLSACTVLKQTQATSATEACAAIDGPVWIGLFKAVPSMATVF